jgi:predicted aldo/keto reductase-like oxidoreductase
MSKSLRPILRRTFLGAAGAAAALAACKRDASTNAAPGASVEITSSGSSVPRRRLGRTGQSVSIVGLGGYHLGKAGEAEAIRMVRHALDHGMNFMDNCWDYHDGRSEERMGAALRDGYRSRAFLMTKIDGRTKRAAAEQIEQSLRRLGTDTIDLVQIHEVIRPSDPGRCFADDGCVHALVDAKKAGKLRFIGFTGHKDPEIHLAMLREGEAHGFVFDAVQLPLNVVDAHYRSFEKMVVPVLVRKDIGVIGMKALASGKIFEANVATAVECLHYAMNLRSSVVVTGCEKMEEVDQAIRAATTFQPMAPAAVTALLERTRAPAKDGKLERFKTTEDHDGTTQHPEWLG